MKLIPFLKAVRKQQLRDPYFRIHLDEHVLPKVWLTISVDLLHNADKTERGQLPNDEAVEAFLRMEGRYAPDNGQKVLREVCTVDLLINSSTSE